MSKSNRPKNKAAARAQLFARRNIAGALVRARYGSLSDSVKECLDAVQTTDDLDVLMVLMIETNSLSELTAWTDEMMACAKADTAGRPDHEKRRRLQDAYQETRARLKARMDEADAKAADAKATDAG